MIGLIVYIHMIDHSYTFPVSHEDTEHYSNYLHMYDLLLLLTSIYTLVFTVSHISLVCYTDCLLASQGLGLNTFLVYIVDIVLSSSLALISSYLLGSWT